MRGLSELIDSSVNVELFDGLVNRINKDFELHYDSKIMAWKMFIDGKFVGVAPNWTFELLVGMLYDNMTTLCEKKR